MCNTMIENVLDRMNESEGRMKKSESEEEEGRVCIGWYGNECKDGGGSNGYGVSKAKQAK